MKIFLTLILFSCSYFLMTAQQTPYEKSDFKSSASYSEMLAYYQALESENDNIKLLNYGLTDVGKPLNVVVIAEGGNFDPAFLRRKNKQVLLINNAIHPGEPCGVDASMMFARDLLTDEAFGPVLENWVVVIIPAYNLGGMLNRSCCTRANQDGPTAQGFRGNARNLDLNRDFIKNDSRNAKLFTKIFHEWKPEVFVDNHTTNGADYPYVMTLIPTQLSKFHPVFKSYVKSKMLPDLYAKMKTSDYEMIPYVNSVSATPDSGIADFMDHPRYSTGYASLFNTIGFTSEAHMLKSFEKRVEACYMFMINMVKIINRDRVVIQRCRKKADEEVKTQSAFHLKWELDKTQSDALLFKGYTAKFKTSEITGMDRLYYDRNETWEREIPYYNVYKPTYKVAKPEAYIIPQAWGEVIERLKNNHVKMHELSEDIEVELECYRIDSFETTRGAYEGHYMHYKTHVSRTQESIQLYAGDYVVYTDQVVNRFIVETLEPEANDSYFNWNFFDAILMQKEYFSAYVFEDLALEIVKEYPQILEDLNEAKAQDSTLAKSSRAQLNFIYTRSKYHEKTHLRYPVYRLTSRAKLPLRK